MPLHRERRWPWITVSYAVLFAVVATVTSFVYDAAAPANQPAVIRIAVALVVAMLLIHLRAYFRGHPLRERPFAFDDALIPRPVAPKLDPGLVKLREEVANSVARRSFFEKVLWPRLSALMRARRQQSELPIPAESRWPGRGPSRRTIAGLLDRIEGAGTTRQ